MTPSPSIPLTQSEHRHTSAEYQSPTNSIRPISPASSLCEFFDCKSELSSSILSTGLVVSGEINLPQEEETVPARWHLSSLWEFFGWGAARNHQHRNLNRRQSLQQERHEERNRQQQETEILDRGDEERSASTTTVDGGQSRMLTAFSNLMHHQKNISALKYRVTGQRLVCGSTFERRGETCTFEEAKERWEPTDATKYRIRSKNYIRTRIKEGCKGNFYEVVASDLISFEKKQTHVAQMVHLPVDPYKRSPEEREAIAEYGLPTLLVVNMQLPVYQPSLFGACDGPGHSFVFYCFLREKFNPRTFQNQAALGLFRRFIRDCRNQMQYRIKLIPKFLNVDEWAEKGPLTATEHRLVHQFNEKPILTRPYQHFFHEPNYFEIDVDVHSWLYVARKALWTLLPRMHEVITEVALLIQGNRPDDLPEHIVAVARVYRVNLTKFRYLSDILEPSSQKEDQDAENSHGDLKLNGTDEELSSLE